MCASSSKRLSDEPYTNVSIQLSILFCVTICNAAHKVIKSSTQESCRTASQDSAVVMGCGLVAYMCMAWPMLL